MRTIFLIILLPSLLFFNSCNEEQNPFTPNNLEFNDQINFNDLGTGVIAFQRINADGSAEGICIINTFNRNTNVITGLMGAPEISPDGNKLVYTSLIDYHTMWDVYMMDLDGSNQINVSNLDGNDAYPSWTPDRKNILFLNYYGFPDLYMVNAYNTSSKTLLYDSDTFQANSPCAFYDAKNIVFSDGGRIKLLNSVDKTLRTLYTPQNGGTYTPRWSADGSKILFLSSKIINIDNTLYNAGGILQLFDIQTNQIDTVYEWDCNNHIDWSGGNELSACWSPDCNKILFNKTGEEFESHLYIINADGTGLKQITSEPNVTDRSVSWSR